MELLIEYYKSANDLRNKEYLFCIEKNLKNEFIDKIHVFIDDPNINLDITSPKLNVVRVANRYTYGEFFRYANIHLSGKKVILANTDIFFDETLKIVNDFNLGEVVLSLTRHDYNMGSGKSEMYYVDMSQDAWIFNAPIIVNDANFLLGKPGCDNKIAYLLHESGYDVRNPSQQIIAHHVHDSKYRTYTQADVIEGMYMTVLPNNNIANQSYKKYIEKF